jgi:hypothetical protein
MSPSDLEIAANRVVEYLRREGAVRLDHDKVGCHKSVYEICDELDIFMGRWTAIKTHMLKRDIPICYVPGKGHYLGFKGEQITNVVYKHQIAKGWVKHLRATKDAIKHSSPEARAWIERRFKDFTVEEEEAEQIVPAIHA